MGALGCISVRLGTAPRTVIPACTRIWDQIIHCVLRPPFSSCLQHGPLPQVWVCGVVGVVPSGRLTGFPHLGWTTMLSLPPLAAWCGIHPILQGVHAAAWDTKKHLGIGGGWVFSQIRSVFYCLSSLNQILGKGRTSSSSAKAEAYQVKGWGKQLWCRSMLSGLGSSWGSTF